MSYESGSALAHKTLPSPATSGLPGQFPTRSMDIVKAVALALAVLAVPVGCGGGSGGSTTVTNIPAAVAGPKDLSVVAGPDINEITLHWTPSAGTVAGYILEVRVGSGEFAALNDTSSLIPAAVESLSLEFTSSAPELVSYTFRLKAVAHGDGSPWTNEAVYQRSLATPRIDNLVYDWDAQAVKVSWTSFSAMADGFKIERAPADGGGNPTGTWTVVSDQTGPPTAFLDQTIEELSRYTYRVTNTRQGTPGVASAPSWAIQTGMLHPTQVRVNPCPGGLQIDWVNHSRRATQIRLQRSKPGTSLDIAVLAAGTSSYQDLNLQPGYYTYTVVAVSESTMASSLPVQGMTAQPPGALALTSQAVTRPWQRVDEVAFRPQGSWAFLSTNPLEISAAGNPWDPYQSEDTPAWGFPIGLYCNRSGQPQAVYERIDPADATKGLFTHVWLDGGWSKASLSTVRPYTSSANPGFAVCMDSQERIHALIDVPDATNPRGGTTGNLVHVYKDGTGWVQDRLASLSPAIKDFDSYIIDVDSTGQPHVLLGLYDHLLELTRPASGGPWTSAAVPTGPLNAGSSDFLRSSWRDPANGHLFFPRSSAGHPWGEESLVVLTKKAGLWEQPLVLGYGTGHSVPPTLARSPDGSRVAVTYQAESGLLLFTNNGSGWKLTILEPNHPDSLNSRIGFDTQGRLHILVYDYSGTTFKEWFE